MYQTLYRKYRPKDFDDMVGQEVIVRTLKNTIRNNKLGHAYLFTGPRGTGKTSVAKILAKTINCEHPIDGIPCNTCSNCQQFNLKQSTDIIEIDAASNNGVDEIRELRSKVNFVPANGTYKIYIIDEVHMLTVGAFNALLKTLEEPPSHILFVLATTEPHKIPATILSRCQRFDFKKISSETIKKRLEYVIKEEAIEAEDDALLEIARLADGGMRDALSILDQVIAYSSEKITVCDVHEINGTITPEELKQFIEAMLNQQLEEVFSMIDIYDQQGKNFVKVIEELIQFLRNILLAMNVPNYLKTKTTNSILYEQMLPNFDESKIMEWITKFNQTIITMKNSNSPRILFELTIIQLINLTTQPLELKPKLVEKVNNQQPKVSDNEKIEIEKQEDSRKQNLAPISQTSSEKNQLDDPIENINQSVTNKFDEWKELEKIRINNTLCNFDRKYLLEAKKSIEEVKTLLLEQQYAELASLVMDGMLKAASKDHFVFVYENDHMVDLFNSNCLRIDEMLTSLYHLPFKCIATSITNWEIIKMEFNSKQKQYTYIEEPIFKMDSTDSLNQKNTIDSMFENLVEYQ